MEWLAGFALLLTLFLADDRWVLFAAIIAIAALGVASILR